MGLKVGILVGLSVGLSDGLSVGLSVGLQVFGEDVEGLTVGFVGFADGPRVGLVG